MKRIIIAFLLIALFAGPAYAVNNVERLLYKEFVIKAYNQKVLVNRFTGRVTYIWQPPTSIMIYGRTIGPDGEWIPIYEAEMQKMWQSLYEKEYTSKGAAQ
ncbi:MAG: hypothetical protein PHI58_04855 [Candidatus Omnitrophica bacterium]|nr:hypothetical protein [Candidatus Omnitrophota bacterium]